ncbi:cullin-3-like [Homalodisca vitripennis]|uniref:cullin-3-like n=1 Tax=Homalodisca vitripennis TaxID=197043 RepID=UPI001EEB708D|nr:cullin-3-like [Homalodisca vitripennis]
MAKTAYYAIFESHLRYGLVVWGGTSKANLQRVLVLQKRAVRILTGLGPRDSCREAFKEQKILTTESQQLLKEKNASLYLRRVDSHVSEETERSKQCFDELTLPKITKVVNDELIRAHMKTVAEMNGSGIVYMIEHQSTDDLSCMYKLYSRVPDGLKTMFNIISHYLRQQGQVLIRDEETNNNALIYVQNLLDLKDKIDFFLINSFSNDRLCKQTIAADFEHILNLNSKSPEYLSLFIDDKLKKTVKVMTDSDKAILLDKTMVLFRFLQDKDLFEQYYNKHLAKRLLLSKVINEENEKDVIVKFKAECGLQYTRKMEGMFRDMWMSTSVTNAFQKHVRDSDEPVHGVDLSVQVLTAVYWPTHQILLPCNVPIVPLTAFSAFKKFYLALHCGRKLTLLPHLGTAELEMYFVRPRCEGEEGEGWQAGITACGEIRSYTLQVSTYQMCILMLFNSRPQWNYQELQEETNICHKDLVRALQILIVGKPSQRVLIKQPNSRKIDHGDFFHVNKSFSSKTNRVRLPTYLIKYESESERQDTMKRINEDRNYEIEAAIIRIMKSRRVMEHENLVFELITMLTPRFVPTRENIKTRIEVLIEREYITRNSEDRRIYEYLA